MKKVNIASVVLGNAEPLKICTPLTGTTLVELLLAAEAAVASTVDLVEWRVDYFSESLDNELLAVWLQELSLILKDIPLIATIRTATEGGHFTGDWEDYARLNQQLIASELTASIDIEYQCPDKQRDELLKQAKKLKKPVILSYHDMDNVPEITVLTQVLDQMTYLNPAIIKMAFMVNNEQELMRLTVLKEQWLIEAPLILIGMGALGQATRVQKDGVLTFADLTGQGQLGQLSVTDIRQQLN